jgi:hypothetical protein
VLAAKAKSFECLTHDSFWDGEAAGFSSPLGILSITRVLEWFLTAFWNLKEMFHPQSACTIGIGVAVL